MVSESDVNELLAKHTPANFLDWTGFESAFADYRSKVITANILIEKLMECLIIKKSESHEDLGKLAFSQKQKILLKLGILNDSINHELKIINKIRNSFAHEIDPLRGEVPDLIRELEFYKKAKIPTADNPQGRNTIDFMRNWQIGSKNTTQQIMVCIPTTIKISNGSLMVWVQMSSLSKHCKSKTRVW